MNDSKDKFDDEIELIDYLRVMWKWKYLIMVGTAVCALAAAVISISMPKVYSVETILQPAVAGISENGEKIYIDSPSKMKEFIEGGSLESEIIQQLQKSNTRKPPIPLQFSINIPANTELLKISYETKTVDVGISILNELIKSLSKEIIDKINYLKTKYDKQIQEKKSEISLSQNELHYTKIKIDNIKKRLAELDTDIQKVEINTEIMTNHRDKYIKNMSDKDILLGYLHINTIQQNLNIRTVINNQIFDYTSELGEAKSDLKRIQIEVDTLSKEIEDLKQKKNEIQNVKLLQPPERSLNALRPRTKLNVMLATVTGFFGMLFLVFVLEYLFKDKKMLKDKDVTQGDEEN
jgi:uncharacterized protein involved in exopolysaccharide biosynthesis